MVVQKCVWCDMGPDSGSEGHLCLCSVLTLVEPWLLYSCTLAPRQPHLVQF